MSAYYFKYGYFFWAWLPMLVVACASSSVPPEGDPCDPPPLCTSALEQSFVVLLEVQNEGNPSLMLAKDASSPANYQISITKGEKAGIWRIDFTRPDQLFWLTDTRFRMYSNLSSKGLRVLFVTVERVKVDCCPQFRIVKMEYEDRVICTECWGKQPILLP